MPRHIYANGYLYCSRCNEHFLEKSCPLHQSKVQKYPTCPECRPIISRMRKKPHNKRWFVYYQNVIKPNFDRDKDVIIKYKWDHPRAPPSTTSK